MIMGFKCIRQLEQSDCGLTCIRMISAYFGKDIPHSELRRISDLNKMGISIKDIRECCNLIGMQAFPVTPTVEELYDIPAPAILHWNQNHFVVLYKTDPKKKRFYIADPARGKLKISEEELKQEWSSDSEQGLAIILSPGETFSSLKFRKDNKKGLSGLLISELKQYKRHFIPVILLSMLCMAGDAGLPLIFRRSIDEGLQMKDIGLVWMFMLSQVGIFLGSSLSSSLTSVILTKLGFKINMEMLGKYLKKLTGKSMDFFDRKSSADLIQKMNDQSRIKSFLVSLPQSIFFTILNFIVFSVLLIIFNPWIFIFFIFMSSLETGWNMLFLNRRSAIDYQSFAESAKNRNLIYELINGISEIRSNNAEKHKLSKWKKSQNSLDSLSLKSTLLGIWMGGGSGLLSNIKDVAITGLCATWVIQGDMTLGTMFTVSYITGSLSGPFRTLISTVTQVQDASLSHDRLDGILSEEGDRTGEGDPISTSISFKDVWFRYAGSSSPYVLKNINLEVNKGETVALVGESGCGKTTMIKLMMGFYRPQKGTVNLGGVKVGELDEDAWLQKCGSVMQNGYIFSNTILENVALSDENPDKGRVRNALTVAGLIDFVDSLPMGMATRIGTTGVELSGGQKQRLLIARAVYRNPEVLFLDEATSSLDARNEHDIHDNLYSFCKGKTVVIAAHRLSTVKNADRILFIENGEIVECGTHEELLDLRARYYHLVRNQLSLSV